MPQMRYFSGWELVMYGLNQTVRHAFPTPLAVLLFILSGLAFLRSDVPSISEVLIRSCYWIMVTNFIKGTKFTTIAKASSHEHFSSENFERVDTANWEGLCCTLLPIAWAGHLLLQKSWINNLERISVYVFLHYHTRRSSPVSSITTICTHYYMQNRKRYDWSTVVDLWFENDFARHAYGCW